ncbi:hypothetical protein HGA91_01100 [candidate division WWE3 bacterium]|nr:hypothetical protein [candidate division WWE3 bacterium]
MKLEEMDSHDLTVQLVDEIRALHQIAENIERHMDRIQEDLRHIREELRTK